MIGYQLFKGGCVSLWFQGFLVSANIDCLLGVFTELCIGYVAPFPIKENCSEPSDAVWSY
jgi:hypothetical protein